MRDTLAKTGPDGYATVNSVSTIKVALFVRREPMSTAKRMAYGVTTTRMASSLLKGCTSRALKLGHGCFGVTPALQRPAQSIDSPVSMHRRAWSPNKSLQGSVSHKVLGRGRSGRVLEQVMRARVLNPWRAAPELNR